jgi:dolichol-phosphate mannosyltransferase
VSSNISVPAPSPRAPKPDGQVTTISIVIPAYNEEGCVAELARRLQAVFAGLAPKYDFEAIIVENGSADSTFECLEAIAAADDRFTIVQLSRNFLMEGGMIAGLDRATGDAAVIMSADLQDPPELIPEFIALWEQGYENIYGVIGNREDNSLFRRAAAQTFYWLIDRMSDTPVPRNASDFRLVDKRMYEAFNALDERNRMIRSTWGWLGFHSIGVEHDRPPRFAGDSHFHVLTTAGFAYRGILASSFKLLRAFPLVGFGLGAISLIAFVVLVIQAVFFGVPFAGYGTLACLITLLFGLLFIVLGVISEYLAMVFTETRNRPLYVVRREIGRGSTGRASR